MGEDQTLDKTVLYDFLFEIWSDFDLYHFDFILHHFDFNPHF